MTISNKYKLVPGFESGLFRKGLRQFEVCDRINKCGLCGSQAECLGFFDSFVVNEPEYRCRKEYLDTIVKRLGVLSGSQLDKNKDMSYSIRNEGEQG